MRKTAWMLARAIAWPLMTLPLIALTLPTVAAEADDQRPGAAQVPWAQWQGRLSLVTATDPWRLGVESPALKLASASLMGDYYFGRSLTGPRQLGGLRATSGLIFGPRSAPSTGQPGPANGGAFSIGNRSFGRTPTPTVADAANENTTLPYLGIGYTGLSTHGGWGFSADLGLIAKSSASTSRIVGQSLDDLVRELRMTPLLQLGVAYTF